MTEPDLIKEILNNKEDAYPKMEMQGYAKKLLGDAMITNEGEKWAKTRKLANHTFHANSLKVSDFIVHSLDVVQVFCKKLIHL